MNGEEESEYLDLHGWDVNSDDSNVLTQNKFLIFWSLTLGFRFDNGGTKVTRSWDTRDTGHISIRLEQVDDILKKKRLKAIKDYQMKEKNRIWITDKRQKLV